MAGFNLTVDQSTAPKRLLQALVDSIRKGQLKTYDSTISGHFTLDIRGFQFKDDQGKSRSIYVLDRDVSNTYYHFYHKI